MRYSIGEPTDDEQYYLELINRARANPPAEGVRLSLATDPDIIAAITEFNVDRQMLIDELEAVPPGPPLAFHPALLAAARDHSTDMFTNVFQGHTSSDGRTLTNRLQAVGYPYAFAAENVFSHAKNPFHGHASFQIDWGHGLGGMQGPPRGHRAAIHSLDYREVGIGVVNGSNSRPGILTVGPQLVTQDFGAQPSPDPLVTGVAYYDLNRNGFYDPGEGLASVRVDIEGSDYHALTVSSGGYAVPVPGNGTYTVSFTGPGLPSEHHQVRITDNRNLKLDYRPTYHPPTLTGPVSLRPEERADYTFSLVGAATAYAWTESRWLTYTRVEDAEQGVDHLLLQVSPGYPVQDLRIAASGKASFHLAMPLPENQTLELPYDLRPGPGAQLLFASRLGYAFSDQVARAQVSIDQGQSWVDLWSRPGETTDPKQPRPGQTAFHIVTAPLESYAGRDIRVRFRFTFAGGYRFYTTDQDTGWHLDDIRFIGVFTADSPITSTVATTEFNFQPMDPGIYYLSVQAAVSGRWLPPGPELQVVVSGAPWVVIDTIERVGDDLLQLQLTVFNGPAGTPQAEVRDHWDATWTSAPTTNLEVTTPGTRYRLTIATGGAPNLFYRVVLQP